MISLFHESLLTVTISILLWVQPIHQAWLLVRSSVGSAESMRCSLTGWNSGRISAAKLAILAICT
jgi:hypothetical protein